jgi:hypothetical protein
MKREQAQETNSSGLQYRLSAAPVGRSTATPGLGTREAG